MSCARPLVIALGLAFAVPLPADANDAAALSGKWRSAPDETPLASAFEEAAWGPNAKTVRTVEMVVRATGDATLTVTREIVDGGGRTMAAATSIETLELVLGASQPGISVRSDFTVSVQHAERRYPDDPDGTWTLGGLHVSVTTFSDDASKLEVRVDTPDGRGSFWTTLRRDTARPSATP